ncbi:TIGR02757 family protein [Treponema sp.]|uniref:TIGR02757 family protein n=1 Tax=Treponema sp. TaxID=166 RepID=UPI00298DBCA7|nr:TIGR02757 family protein [Treponema sp.]MCR5613794.1 TIGR02757 family protein [Treponema sp.]
MNKISPALKKDLTRLAQKYETADFLISDPSQFLRHYSEPKDIELCAFVAALLAFGNRKQFIPKIQFIIDQADNAGGIYNWILNRGYNEFFPAQNTKKFYRFYSYKDINNLFSALNKILKTEQTLGIYFHSLYNEALNISAAAPHLIDIIASSFAGCSIVPQTKTSAKKRLCMFLRWMVRDNSAVDLGLWTWYPKSKLIIPLDVHVLAESQKLGLIAPGAAATRKTAEALTECARQIFPDDPTRLDFALFGYGVDKSHGAQ